MIKKRNSKQRQLILEAVQGRSDHPTADQIYLDVRAKDDRISRGTVYRNLGVLSEEGQIASVKVPVSDHFDFCVDRHYHLFCTGCGRVFDTSLPYHEEYDNLVAEENGFKVSRHHMFFEGLCRECIQKDKK